VGLAGGWFWEHGGWTGVAGLAGAVALSGAAVGLSLKARPGR
jgi:YNFM family putative membrane transporter